MNQRELMIPTYNGNLFPDDVEENRVEEYGDPHVPVTVYQQSGIRVVLGTHDPDVDMDKPDLLIERQPNAWGVFIHPDGGDPSGLFYILDDGRSYFVPETCPAFASCTCVEDNRAVPGLFAPLKPQDFEWPSLSHVRSSRLLPRNMRDLGVVGHAIHDAIAEIAKITSVERLDAATMVKVVNKHLAQLGRPRDSVRSL